MGLFRDRRGSGRLMDVGSHVPLHYGTTTFSRTANGFSATHTPFVLGRSSSGRSENILPGQPRQSGWVA